jgi:hypothetical protein
MEIQIEAAVDHQPSQHQTRAPEIITVIKLVKVTLELLTFIITLLEFPLCSRRPDGKEVMKEKPKSKSSFTVTGVKVA